MNAEEYLESIKIQDRVVKRMRSEAEAIREAMGVKGVNYENIGAGKGTPSSDIMGEAIAKLIDFENEVKVEEMKLGLMRMEATKAINTLDSEDQREILTRWYLRFQNPKTISEFMSLSLSRVYAIRKSAVNQLVIKVSKE